MNLIVAVDKHWGIGKENNLLFNIPEDMKFFRETTTGKIIVMGRKTLESFPGGKPLKNRTNIVLTTDEGFKCDGVLICRNLEQLADLLEQFNSCDVFVSGGQAVYEQLYPYCETAFVTKVRSDGNATKFFPNLDSSPGWELKKESEVKISNSYEFTICEYHNKNVKLLK